MCDGCVGGWMCRTSWWALNSISGLAILTYLEKIDAKQICIFTC